jgi:L-lactate utilization protein LutC
VADTGSVVLAHGAGRGRSAVLLPPTHVTLLEADRVVPSIVDAYERLAELDELPSNVAFHTGPSRSGDLEQIPVFGVHGPGDVHVVVLG